MSERLRIEGHLAVERQKEQKLRLQLEGLRDSIREKLDPLEDPADLEVNIVLEQAIQMANAQLELKATLAKIAKAKKLLGG